jgi:hypothetical protein
VNLNFGRKCSEQICIRKFWAKFRPKTTYVFYLKKRLPRVGSKPGASRFNLISHFTTLPLSHSGSPATAAPPKQHMSINFSVPILWRIILDFNIKGDHNYDEEWNYKLHK